MDKIALVENSELLNKEWGIPAFFPQTNQPHLNTAIVFRCVEIIPYRWFYNYLRFLESCRFGEYYSRRPNREQNLSKDEAVGIGAIESFVLWTVKGATTKIVETLDKNFYIYPNELGEFKLKRFWGRHIHIKPFLCLASFQGRSTLLLRIWFYYSMYANKRHNFRPESVLQAWLMGPAMKTDYKCKKVYEKWCQVMNKRGISPKLIFSEHWMQDAPTLAKIAPSKFD
jgi:hypothetical protein